MTYSFAQKLKELGIADYTFKTKKKDFHIPRIFLLLHSQYFYNKFIPWKSDNEILEETYDQFDSETIEMIVRYLSFGFIEFNSFNVIKVYAASNFFQISNLHDNCCQYIECNMTPDLIIEAYPFLQSGELIALQDAFENVVIDYATDLFLDKYYSRLTLDLLYYIITTEDIQVPNENYILKALQEIYLINRNCMLLSLLLLNRL